VTDEELDRLARQRGYTFSMEIRDGRHHWFWAHPKDFAPRFESERQARLFLQDRLQQRAIVWRAPET
jgi:hypothetical protein